MTAENNKAVLTIVEPIDFAEEARKEAHKQAQAKKDSDKSFISLTLNQSTVELIHKLLNDEFDRNITEFNKLLELTEASKDLCFDEQSGEFIDFLKSDHPEEYLNHLAGSRSDYSSADGKEV
jgi:hypothetical protein